jgi:Flp pilus assembly protein TadG
MPTFLRSARTDRTRRRPRGQIVVLFAGSALMFMLLCAAVVDISWYWTNNLRMQRAADAAALAGVVYLPGNVGNAGYIAAAAEATKNGYTNNVNGFTVVALKDPNNDRRLVVTINGPVGTFFARVVGINSWPAQRVARADFVLPVPMGSPQNYFGVSALLGTVNTPSTSHATTAGSSGLDVPTGAPGAAGWSATPSAGNSLVSVVASSGDSTFARTTSSTSQQWGSFGLPTLAANQSITGNVTGLQVTLVGARLSAACASTTNRIGVALSWNGGISWTTISASTQTTNMTTTTPATTTFGSAADTLLWTGHTTWTATQINDLNFQVRLTAVKGCGSGGTDLRVDQIQVQAFFNIDTATTTYTITDDPTQRVIADPLTSAALASQGFWGASITSGGERGNGDRYGPAYNGKPTANPTYDGKGVDYSVEVGALGAVSIYDATFCMTGGNLTGGSYGAGDHYIGTVGPVTTVYTLWDTRGTPYNQADDVQKATSGTLFAGEQQRDHSGSYGDPGASDPDCSTMALSTQGGYWHNKWYPLATGLPAGTYRLNVSTADPGNINTSAENMWSVWATGGATPRVYGGGSMVAYTNLPKGTSSFYLAQIPKEHAGKTMIITLFDPGDVTGGAWLRILSPDGNAYNPATFTYTADSNASTGHTSGSGTCIQTNGGTTTGVSAPPGCLALTSGGTFFQNSVMQISIPLPATYGNVGLTPSGVPNSEAGWWKIEYTVGGGNDTTTWNVSIRGNPVHLILP